MKVGVPLFPTLVHCLEAVGYHHLILKSRAELNLLEQAAVRDFFAAEKPDYVFLAAAKVGGIHANNVFPADFIYQNLMIEAN
ncbi:MAG: NAD-dependent epimerase/dehydratase family protein, partial [Deltaproteobacteria bacterium]|nr:NAD-dependent epimerase/dehydratase family protein [Deltaproteobacteria bacterium]